RLRAQAPSRGRSRGRHRRGAGGRALRLRRGGDERQGRGRPVRAGATGEDARHVHAVPRAQAQGAARGDLHERSLAGEEVMTVLIRGARVLAGSPAALSRAAVLIDGDRVAAVGPALAAPADARVLDATGRILLPGLGNAHTHAASHLARGRAGNWTLEDLLTNAPANYGFRTPEDDYLSAAIGAIEMLKTGCTSAYDLYMAVPAITDEAFEATVRAYTDVGVRVVLAPAVADVVFYETVPGLLSLLPDDLR